MDPEKVSAIVDWKTPTTVKAVRSFLGFANYYQLFISGLSNIAKPLFDRTKNDTLFEWIFRQEAAFNDLKQRFIEGPVLATYNPEQEMCLEPGASRWAVGRVISQFATALQLWHPIAFVTTKHSPAESNYDIHNKELLAIVK